MHHLLQLRPDIGVLLRAQGHMCPVKPVQIPVFYAMGALVGIDEDAKLVGRSAPAQLPSPVSLQLVRPCLWIYVIEAKPLDVVLIFGVGDLKIFQSSFKLLLHEVGAAFFSNSLRHIFILWWRVKRILSINSKFIVFWNIPFFHYTYIVPLYPIVKREGKRSSSRQSIRFTALEKPTKSANLSPMEIPTEVLGTLTHHPS